RCRDLRAPQRSACRFNFGSHEGWCSFHDSRSVLSSEPFDRLPESRASARLDANQAAGQLPKALEDFVTRIECRLTLNAKFSSRDDQISQCSTEAPSVEIQPDDLAYIAFTSGSTGQPKGVMGRHGPLTLFTSWAKEEFELDEADRFCMLSGLAHDPLHR